MGVLGVCSATSMERYSIYFLERRRGTGCNSFLLILLDIRNRQDFVGEMFSALWENADPSERRVWWKTSEFPGIEIFFREKLQKPTFLSVNSKTGFVFLTVVFQKKMRKAQAKM